MLTKSKPNMKEVIHKVFYDSTTALSGAGVADVASHHQASGWFLFFAASLAPVVRDLLVSFATWLASRIKQRFLTK